jgi:hypothetical protein
LNDLVNFDAILDGTGNSGVVRDEVLPTPGSGQLVGGKYKFRNQQQAFALTMNFKRYPGDDVAMVAKSYVYHQAEFNSKKIAIGNIVYYQSAVAHYVVCTVTVDTLLEQQVLRQNLPSDELLRRDNLDRAALQKVVFAIAEDWGVPHKEGLYMEGPSSQGRLFPSFAVFEFTRQTIANKFFDIMDPPRDEPDDEVVEASHTTCCCKPRRCGSDFTAGAWVFSAKIELQNTSIAGETGTFCCQYMKDGCDAEVQVPVAELFWLQCSV